MTKRYMSPLRAAEILGVGPKVVSEYLGTALKVAFYVESHGGLPGVAHRPLGV